MMGVLKLILQEDFVDKNNKYIMDYIDILKRNYCWDNKNNNPHKCLIKGMTKVNCEWFNEDIILTKHGEKQIRELIKNNK